MSQPTDHQLEVVRRLQEPAPFRHLAASRPRDPIWALLSLVLGLSAGLAAFAAIAVTVV